MTGTQQLTRIRTTSGDEASDGAGRAGDGADPQVTAEALRMLRELHAMHGPSDGRDSVVQLG